MGQKIDHCDIIDILEESVTAHRAVNVATSDGDAFVDRVRDVVTENGRDFAVFEGHGRMPVAAIRQCTPTITSHTPLVFPSR